MEEEKLVLIVGDSTSLPRDNLDYSLTWEKRLKDYFNNFDVINRSDWGSTTNLLKKKNLLEFFNPDYVIIQLGIVDCAPRLFSSFERRVISDLPRPLRGIYIAVNSRIRRRSEKRAYVEIERFKENILNYLERAHLLGVEKVVLIKILEAGNKYLQNNKMVQSSIKKYNTVLEEIAISTDCELIDLKLSKDELDSVTLEDGYHINESGHKLIFEKLKEVFARPGK